MANIVLQPSQVTHVERLQEILRQNPFALDLSALGSGKTYVGASIAMNPEFKFRHVIIIAPVSVQTKWKYMQKTYNVPISANLSFCGVRSVKGKQPKHGLLKRTDYVEQMRIQGKMMDIDKVTFTASETFKRYIAEGVLVVMDEIQNIKNVSSQFAACQALIRPIVEARSPNAKVLLLSGSPIDKEEQAVTLLRSLHIMKQDKLAAYDFGSHQTDWLGMNDIVSYCYSFNRAATTQILNTYHYHLRNKVYSLFQKVIKPHIAHAMAPPTATANITKMNGYYDIEDEDEQIALKDAVYALESAARYNRQTGTINLANTNISAAMGAITTALMKIESAKLSTFIRIVRDKLQSDRNTKVVVCLNYNSSMDRLMDELGEYKPVKLNGSMSMIQRTNALAKFQAESTEHRLLIGNMAVCSTGIDLDDKNGKYPRVCFASPNYAVITIHQLGHRFLRLDTKSDSILHLVFGQQHHESGVLGALARKSTVMKQTTEEQVTAGIVFPSDYAEYEEPSAAERLEIKRNKMVTIIQKRWLEMYYNPKHPVCQRRLAREFENMVI